MTIDLEGLRGFIQDTLDKVREMVTLFDAYYIESVDRQYHLIIRSKPVTVYNV
jgi:hypothetical protein